ncbi:MAG: DUF1805 domain-containing protein [Candidatus Omnitrophica bacterium]|nr:DUF1805 domain-containing protein [Candidatus Omnitrophota bacterium]MDD5653279.1 DUF1805 domain-containing protein [Candidatus Omnitrophota bacterium]
MKIRPQAKIQQEKIQVGEKYIQACLVPFFAKNLIVLLGEKGYVMCGYLDLTVAEKFSDPAVRIVGVSTIQEALGTKVDGCTAAARELGIHKDQPISEVLKLIV